MSKVYLETYKYRGFGHTKLFGGLDGESKQVAFSKDFLLNAIYPQTLDEFLDSYTYDDVEELLQRQKAIKERKKESDQL